jgi:ferredoxin
MDRKKLRFKELKCIGCGLCISQCDKSHSLSLIKRLNYTPPNESIAHLAADLGLQSFGLGKFIDKKFPAGYHQLKKVLGSGIETVYKKTNII